MSRLLPAAGLLLLASCPTAPPPATAPSSIVSHVDFDSQVKPILQTRCTPCHFPGGVMHAQLPFDQARTIHDLGEKLFTRIKDEQEQVLLRTFLAQAPQVSTSTTTAVP
jgi:hypothetical protein